MSRKLVNQLPATLVLLLALLHSRNGVPRHFLSLLWTDLHACSPKQFVSLQFQLYIFLNHRLAISMSDRFLHPAWQSGLPSSSLSDGGEAKFGCISRVKSFPAVLSVLHAASFFVQAILYSATVQTVDLLPGLLHVKEAARIGIFGSGAKPVQQAQTLMSRAGGSPISHLLWQMCLRDFAKLGGIS